VASEESAELPSSVRVLVVDDDQALCRQLAASLAVAGYQVVTAHDVEGAQRQTEATQPDVAIVDLGLPTSGLNLIKHVKGLYGSAIHVLVLTGADEESSRAAAFDAGADDYVVKPASMGELKRRLRAAAAKQRAYVVMRHEKEASDRRIVYGHEATALLAHDLNNGLAVSLSNLQYLMEVMETADTDQKEAVSVTLRSLRRMSGLVANFVDIARFEDAAVKPVVGHVNVRGLITSVMEVNVTSFTRGVTWRVDCEPGLEARFDHALIERVLHNLVGNASRYCNADGEIVVAGRRMHDTDDVSVEISVVNSGPLIAEKTAANLFGKYQRGSGGKRGMGLYFCRLVAEAHGGRIDYEATPIGPSFVLRLPGRA